jgi:hypothetical protein
VASVISGSDVLRIPAKQTDKKDARVTKITIPVAVPRPILQRANPGFSRWVT